MSTTAPHRHPRQDGYLLYYRIVYYTRISLDWIFNFSRIFARTDASRLKSLYLCADRYLRRGGNYLLGLFADQRCFRPSNTTRLRLNITLDVHCEGIAKTAAKVGGWPSGMVDLPPSCTCLTWGRVRRSSMGRSSTHACG